MKLQMLNIFGKMKNIKKFIKQFSYLKALPIFITIMSLGLVEVIMGVEIYEVCLITLASMPFIYLIACVKTSFEKKIDYISEMINKAYQESNPIKKAIKMSVTSQRISNSCAAESMYGIKEEKEYWLTLSRFYNDMNKNWREELSNLSRNNVCQ